MVELQPSKLTTRVRFPSPAPEIPTPPQGGVFSFRVTGIEPRWGREASGRASRAEQRSCEAMRLRDAKTRIPVTRSKHSNTAARRCFFIQSDRDRTPLALTLLSLSVNFLMSKLTWCRLSFLTQSHLRFGPRYLGLRFYNPVDLARWQWHPFYRSTKSTYKAA